MLVGDKCVDLFDLMSCKGMLFLLAVIHGFILQYFPCSFSYYFLYSTSFFMRCLSSVTFIGYAFTFMVH